jgi:hypothetical protein
MENVFNSMNSTLEGFDHSKWIPSANIFYGFFVSKTLFTSFHMRNFPKEYVPFKTYSQVKKSIPCQVSISFLHIFNYLTIVVAVQDSCCTKNELALTNCLHTSCIDQMLIIVHPRSNDF